MKLFVYDHCPFCMRARMIFGLKHIPVELVILASDDDDTPTRMIGQKMVPILQKPDGSFMPESLDIVHYIDQEYAGPSVLTGSQSEVIASLLKDIQSVDYKLLYPRFIKLGLPEFSTQQAKISFEHRKQARSGPFSECLAATEQLVKQVDVMLVALDDALIATDACNGELSLDDICLFPILRNLTCVKAISFPAKVKAYLELMAKRSQVDLYFDRAL